MHFTDEAIDKIFETYKKDEKLVITGCNGMGIEFETCGWVATVLGSDVPETKNEPNTFYAAIMDNCLILDFGTPFEGEYKSDFCCPFYNSFSTKNINALIIKDIKIKKTGKIIFENTDYEKYYNAARENLIGYGKAYLSSGLTPANMDTVCQSINNHIGQPINIYGRTGILYFADKSRNGEILIEYYNFSECRTTAIPRNSDIKMSRNVLKISAPTQKSTFADYLINKGRNI